MIIKDFLLKMEDSNLYHIDILYLQKSLGLSKKELLDNLINLVFEGTLMIEWIYHCPHCGNVAKDVLSLHDASHEDYCGKCKVHFSNCLDNNIEVFFNIHPGIRELSNVYKNEYYENLKNDLEIYGNNCWKKENTVFGLELIQNNNFRNLIGDDILKSDQSLEILKVTILFTDVKGSTKLYNTLGDMKAFSLIREHFKILFEVISNNNGIPVKTIGDAIMGVFLNEEDGLKASLEMQENLIKFYGDKKQKIEIRIGVHTGSSLLVNLNEKLDYFGQSVNRAARIESSAEPNEVVISYDIFERNTNLIKSNSNISFSEKIYKGFEEKQKLVHILFKERKFLHDKLIRFKRIFESSKIKL